MMENQLRLVVRDRGAAAYEYRQSEAAATGLVREVNGPAGLSVNRLSTAYSPAGMDFRQP